MTGWTKDDEQNVVPQLGSPHLVAFRTYRILHSESSYEFFPILPNFVQFRGLRGWLPWWDVVDFSEILTVLWRRCWQSIEV